MGIGTLYRRFPTRQVLLEAVYVDEVDALCRFAGELEELEPWTALASWLQRFVGFMATKHALTDELLTSSEPDIFATSRTALFAAVGPLLQRAQRAGAARDDVNADDLVRLVGGIAKTTTSDPAQTRRLLDLALDGLRHRTP